MNQSEGRRCRLGLQQEKRFAFDFTIISPDVPLRFISLFFSSSSHKPLARSPSLSRVFFSFIFFLFSAPPPISLFLSLFLCFFYSPSIPPLLFAHVFRMLLRAVATAEKHNYRSALPRRRGTGGTYN